MSKYIVNFDETYRLNGERSFQVFDNEEDAVAAYQKQHRGFASILVESEGIKKLLLDEDGRKYIKGSPFYYFPHVPHTSILDGKEIETT
jgi:hypothetical protein